MAEGGTFHVDQYEGAFTLLPVLPQTVAAGEDVTGD